MLFNTVMNKEVTRVLLIVSSLHNSEAIQGILESRGLEVYLFSLNGKIPDPEIFANIDVIIFDSGNLTTEGYLHCTTIRKLSHIPLLVLSTLNQPQVIANMLDCGADDFISKPISSEVLIAHINKLTRRARSNRSK